ncbi:hypothetical protein [Streptomyces sp. NPDC004976]
MTTEATDRPHLDVIASALSDWWLTADPARPFDINVVARAVDARLTRSGYTIAPDTGGTPMHTTCDASLDTGFTNPLGPCVLRHGHAGPVHKDAAGATWWTGPNPTPPTRRAAVFTAVLALLFLAGGIVTAAREAWQWAIPCGIAWSLASWATADAHAERRDHRRRRHT